MGQQDRAMNIPRLALRQQIRLEALEIRKIEKLIEGGGKVRIHLQVVFKSRRRRLLGSKPNYKLKNRVLIVPVRISSKPI